MNRVKSNKRRPEGMGQLSAKNLGVNIVCQHLYNSFFFHVFLRVILHMAGVKIALIYLFQSSSVTTKMFIDKKLYYACYSQQDGSIVRQLNNNFNCNKSQLHYKHSFALWLNKSLILIFYNVLSQKIHSQQTIPPRHQFFLTGFTQLSNSPYYDLMPSSQRTSPQDLNYLIDWHTHNLFEHT